MPSKFTLFLSGGIRIYSAPRQKAFSPAWQLRLFRRLEHLGPPGEPFVQDEKEAFAAIDIKLEKKEDGQAVFWAFPDGTKGLGFSPLIGSPLRCFSNS